MKVIANNDFAAVDIEAPIRDSNKVDCFSLASLFQSASKQQQGTKNEITARVYGLLSDVARMHFKPEDKAMPYGPHYVIDGRRSIIPSDLRGEQSSVFAEIASDIQNPGLRARLSDIAWHNDRKLPSMAQQAVNAYCDAVQAVLDGSAEFFHENRTASSRDGCNMLQRASQIASTTGWKDPEGSRLKSLVRAVIRDAFDREDHRGYLHSGEIGLRFRIEEPATIAANAETLASTNPPEPHTSRDLWQLAAHAHRISANDQARDQCLVSAAECLVTLADDAGGQGMVAASHLMDAIEALRQVRNTQERRRELESKLLDAQASIRDEMGVIPTEVDLTELVQHARRCVRGLSLAQALAEFVSLSEAPPPDALRDEALQLAEENPLYAIMPFSMHDDDGKVVAKSPGLAGDEDEGDLALRHLIAGNERLRRQSDVEGMLEPARQLIQAEHPLDQRDFLVLAAMSPVVPTAHADLFAVGFARYFGGDFISALHILIPQLENLLRHVLKQAGVEPSAIHSDMTQENRSLSVMLARDREALEGIFGPAIIHEIEGLFDFRGGPTLRHQLAHGLISADGCYHPDSIYACWFIFRLCCVPLFPHWQTVAERLDQL